MNPSALEPDDTKPAPSPGNGKKRTAVLAFLAVVALSGCFLRIDRWMWESEAAAPFAPAISPIERTAGPAFVDVTDRAGIRHRHSRPVLDSRLEHIMPWVSSVGAAAAAGDFNNDGRIDLFATNSRKGEPNYLYRNDGPGEDGAVTFTDVAESAGLARLNNDDGVGMDAVWGDYDNDGRQDLYLLRWGRDALFKNNGDGTFTDVTARSFRRGDGSRGSDWKNGNSVVFLDYDLDGRLDLYVGNYFADFDLWHLDTTRIMHDDFERARNGGRNQLFHQEEDGTFTDRAAAAGVDDPGWTLAVGAADVDNDGFPDLYAANDFGPDQLWLNRGDGSFANVSADALGVDTKKGMNVDFGDFNNDGRMDIYVTNITTAEYLQEGNMLWFNNGPGAGGAVSFTDVSMETGTFDGGWGWGAKFFDYDNDGDLDLASANGFVSAGEGNYWYDLASWTVTGQDPADAANWPPIGDRSFSGHERLRLWENVDTASFRERATALGVDSTRDGRGIVTFDYDNDGDLDLFVANQHQKPELYENRGTRGSWLEVELAADPRTGVNRDAVGARVTVVTAHRRLIRERDGGNSFAGQSDPRLHFGLGDERRVDLLEVRWPDGGLQYLEDVAVDRVVSLRQDPGAYARRVEIEATPARPRTARRADSGDATAVDPETLERELAAMEKELGRELGKAPRRYGPAAAYRALSAAHGEHRRAIRFFEERVAADPGDATARIDLASAYIDKIPTCGGVAAIICKGTLARKALDQLDAVLEADPDSWVALYCRGTNHLHWPRALRHSAAAAADLERCAELQERRGDRRAHYLRVYVALGDAYAKAGDYERARQSWRRGREIFPGAKELETRLAAGGDKELLAYVEAERSLEQPIDTDLSFLDSAEESGTGR